MRWDNGGVNQLYPDTLFDQINAALPQTQCTRCGYIDCAAYAHAIASNEVPINRCPPGGAEGIRRLSKITGFPIQPLNPLNGQEGPRAVAVIDEDWCIGCTLCITACPVDAIIGSSKMMHTVIEAVCTGCELCLPVCPVDCISLEDVSGSRTGWDAWSEPQARIARENYEIHSYRSSQEKRKAAKALEKNLEPPLNSITQPTVQTQLHSNEAERKRAAIKAALERSRAQRMPKL